MLPSHPTVLCYCRADFIRYRKEKVLNIVDQRTGRKMTSREIDNYQVTEDKKERDIVQVCIALSKPGLPLSISTVDPH